MQQGLVISDLHLFSRRSRAEELLAGIKGEIIGADVLVLNGDVFDFDAPRVRDGQSEHHDLPRDAEHAVPAMTAILQSKLNATLN